MIGGSEVSSAVRAGAREMLATRAVLPLDGPAAPAKPGAKGEAKAKGESERPARRSAGSTRRKDS
jgi:hypothetical protein